MIKPLQAIVAISENRVIGNGGQIPWHLPEDFRWFKEKTMGHTLIMGRKTYESIGRPLPGRRTLVLSRTGTFEGVTMLRDPVALATGLFDGQGFVCGGAEIYRLLMPQCSDLWVTHVHRVVHGDVLFPPFEDGFEKVGVVRETPDFTVVHYRGRSDVPAAADSAS